MPLALVWRVLKSAGAGWIADRAPSMGAAISFYTVFSLAPMLILVIAIAGLAFGQEAAQGALVAEFHDLLGRDGAEALQAMIVRASDLGRGLWATAFGIVTLLIGATTVFAELQSSLNLIWKAQASQEAPLMWMLRVRLAGLALIAAVGFLLLVSLVVSTAIAVVNDWLSGVFPAVAFLVGLLHLLVSLTVTTTLFAMIYRFLPDTRIPWSDVWVGAVITALLFSAGKELISLYIGNSQVASGYGAAGALVIILLWVYYSAQIFLFGAEITRAWSETHGSRSRRPRSAQSTP